MGACASAPREPHPEAREDADVPAPSFRAKATATSSLVDPEVGRSVRHDRRASGVSRDNSKNGASETRGAPVADLAGCPVATAKRGRSRLSVSSPKKKSGGEEDAASFPTPREAHAWPAWLSAHAGDTAPTQSRAAPSARAPAGRMTRRTRSFWRNRSKRLAICLSHQVDWSA